MKPESCYAVSLETSLPHPAEALNTTLASAFHAVSADTHPAILWRRAGLARIAGSADGPGLIVPVSLAAWVEAALNALRAIADVPQNLPTHGAALLGERARLLNIRRNGRRTPRGFGRLIATQTELLALNMARQDDWDLLPAWLEAPAQTWDDIETLARDRFAHDLLQRGRELGMAIGIDHLPARPATYFALSQASQIKPVTRAPLVIDLSSLWAGPLCSSLLSMAGAEVIKVESRKRPDGARTGDAGFFALLNASKKSVVLDLSKPEGCAQLQTLLRRADMVIEASRPRALRQMGIIAQDIVTEKPGMIWVSLTAYGRAHNAIGFGDDIGVSAGLSRVVERAYGRASFVGDAIADPVSGVFAALTLWSMWRAGQGGLVDMPMVDVVRYAMGEIAPDLARSAQDWTDIAARDTRPLFPMRDIPQSVPPLGADTACVLNTLC